MSKLLSFLKNYLPGRFQRRRFMLDQYHFDLTSFDGDVSEWVAKFPITNQNVEIYFALAELFRRRGEFDKAVSVHEAISKAKIDGHSISEIILEIAQDYYAAGVLGHAEELLVKALEEADDTISRQAFRLWLAILESEQDWERAVQLVEQYGISGSGGLRLANLYCEYVNLVRHQKPTAALVKVLKKATKLEVSTRAELMTAELLTEQNQIASAISLYRNLLLKKPIRADLVLAPMRQISLANESLESFARFMTQLYKRHPSVRILEVLLDLHLSHGFQLTRDIELALEQQVSEGYSQSILSFWMKQYSVEVTEAIKPLMPALKKNFLSYSDPYVCIECGFHTEKLAWLCPQCGAWETMYSQYELEIDQKIKKVS